MAMEELLGTNYLQVRKVSNASLTFESLLLQVWRRCCRMGKELT
jgi:hypothetical protein